MHSRPVPIKALNCTSRKCKRIKNPRRDVRKGPSGLTPRLLMGRSDRKRPKAAMRNSFPRAWLAGLASVQTPASGSHPPGARGRRGRAKAGRKLSFPASLAARLTSPRAKPACAGAVAGRADGGGEAVASSVLVRSQKRVRAVGRCRSPVRSLVSAAAGSGGRGTERDRQLLGGWWAPPGAAGGGSPSAVPQQPTVRLTGEGGRWFSAMGRWSRAAATLRSCRGG